MVREEGGGSRHGARGVRVNGYLHEVLTALIRCGSQRPAVWAYRLEYVVVVNKARRAGLLIIDNRTLRKK
jgi:hypothetical protein